MALVCDLQLTLLNAACLSSVEQPNKFVEMVLSFITAKAGIKMAY